jgi:hypothetical protein
MVYGRRPVKRTNIENKRVSAYATTGRSARQAKYRKNRTPVAKILRKPYVPVNVKQNASLMSLSRAVNKLQHQQLGLYQKRTEKMNIECSTDGFSRSYPLAFCLNQFNDAGDLHAQVYKVNTSSGAGELLKRFELQNMGVIYGTTTSAYTPYNPHWGCNDDTPSAEAYQPLGTKVRFEVEFENVPQSAEPKWIRIDMVRPKKQYVATPTHELTMPVGLLQFANIAAGDMLRRNYINPSMWHVQTKWCKLENRQATTASLKKIITISRSFKNSKLIKPDYNSTTGANFTTNVPYMQKEWCIISCGDSAPTTINIQRFTSWRDQHGVAA